MVARSSGREPTFLFHATYGQARTPRKRDKGRRQNRMDLAPIREAAERVARSEGLEVFDVEWKIGKQRLLRIYLDRLPGPENPAGARRNS